MRYLRLGIHLYVLAASVLAQTAPQSKFEVATVKAIGPDIKPGIIGTRGGPGTADPGQITLSQLTLKRILTYAYQLKSYQVTGPSWIDDDRFTIVAKVPPGTTRDDAFKMMQNLIVERFRLESHHVSKEMPLYELVQAKGGFKLKPNQDQPSAPRPDPSAPPSGGGGRGSVALAGEGRGPGVPEGAGPGYHRMSLPKTTIARLASLLDLQMNLPVIDKTGIDGEFAIKLEYTIHDAFGDVPTVFTALQETLGLKLEAKKGPVEILVVDRAERTPGEN